MEYAFCEHVGASAHSRWHILGGGADTSSLCGVEVAWDLAGYNH